MEMVEIPWGLATRLAELGRRIERKRKEGQKIDAGETANIMVELLKVDKIVDEAYKSKGL